MSVVYILLFQILNQNISSLNLVPNNIGSGKSEHRIEIQNGILLYII